MNKTILILGGGTGGVVAANILRKLTDKNHRIIVIDRNDTHYFKASLPLLLVGKRQPQQIIRKLSNLQQKGIHFLKDNILQIQPEYSQVKTNQGTIVYDYLIVALGVEYHPETVPGLANIGYNPYDFQDILRLQRELSQFNHGNIVVFLSSLPYTGLVAPYEFAFLLDSFFRYHKHRHRVKITLVTPEPFPIPLAAPKVGESLREMLERRQVKLITQAKILAIDQSTKELVLDNGMHIPADLFLGIPSQTGSQVIQNSGLATEGGWMEVDPHTMATRFNNVYGVGDGAAIRMPITKEWAPKAGVFAHFQAEVVARNIALQIAGKPAKFRYRGKAAGAAMITDLQRARLISVNYYAKPYSKAIMLRPTIMGYGAKVAFEKYWLNRWF